MYTRNNRRNKKKLRNTKKKYGGSDSINPIYTNIEYILDPIKNHLQEKVKNKTYTNLNVEENAICVYFLECIKNFFYIESVGLYRRSSANPIYDFIAKNNDSYNILSNIPESIYINNTIINRNKEIINIINYLIVNVKNSYDVILIEDLSNEIMKSVDKNLLHSYILIHPCILYLITIDRNINIEDNIISPIGSSLILELSKNLLNVKFVLKGGMPNKPVLEFKTNIFLKEQNDIKIFIQTKKPINCMYSIYVKEKPYKWEATPCINILGERTYMLYFIENDTNKEYIYPQDLPDLSSIAGPPGPPPAAAAPPNPLEKNDASNEQQEKCHQIMEQYREDLEKINETLDNVLRPLTYEN